jgi:hypothetical protein
LNRWCVRTAIAFQDCEAGDLRWLAAVEDLEVFFVQAGYRVALGIADDDGNKDSIHIDFNC